MSLTHQRYPSPLGELLAVFSARGLCLLEFVGQPRLERELAQVEAARGGPGERPSERQRAWAEQLGAELADYFAGRRQAFAVPLDLIGTPFQQRVWQALRAVPAGQTLSYAELARRIGQPRAARAVARACASNVLAVAIPCHRVVRGDGALAGYRWGVARKQALLESEGWHEPALNNDA